MTTPRPDPRLGTDLGPYHIEAVIGRGGMGVVYRATDTRLDRPVALKLLTPDLAEDEGFRRRFVRESQMAAAIDDPNIIPIYEAGEIEGGYFLAMRFVEGTDLEARLRAGPLAPADGVHLLAQVASALDAAHARGLVHRDVKPANVLVAAGTQLDRPDHVYLTDFGLTKHRGAQTGFTRGGAFLGTLAYIAPEQIEGRDVDGRADQYSLACVAFQCLTGQTPFPRDNDVAVINAHLRDKPPAVAAFHPDVAPATDGVIERAMAKRADARYPSCGAFVDALREALGVRPSERHARPQSGPERRTRVIAVAAFMVLLGVATLGGLSLLSGRGAVPTPTGGSPSGSAGASGVAASPSGSSAGASFPSLDEASLVLSLPDDLPADCVRGAEELLTTRQGPSLKPRAHVTCALTGGSAPDVIDGYVLPPTDFGFGDVLDAIAQREGVAQGDCATSPEARGSWQIEDRAAGDMVCFRDPGTGDAVIAWGIYDSRALFRAVDTAGDPAALYEWFAANAANIAP